MKTNNTFKLLIEAILIIEKKKLSELSNNELLMSNHIKFMNLEKIILENIEFYPDCKIIILIENSNYKLTLLNIINDINELREIIFLVNYNYNTLTISEKRDTIIIKKAELKI